MTVASVTPRATPTAHNEQRFADALDATGLEAVVAGTPLRRLARAEGISKGHHVRCLRRGPFHARRRSAAPPQRADPVRLRSRVGRLRGSDGQYRPGPDPPPRVRDDTNDAREEHPG